MNSLQPPTDISGNGQEIWDWASRLAAHVQRQSKRDELAQQLAGLDSECGSCTKWMTKRCPHERLSVASHSNGPNCNSRICSEFSMKSYVVEMIAELKSKLEALDAEEPR
jgi:hypothetical protein